MFRCSASSRTVRHHIISLQHNVKIDRFFRADYGDDDKTIKLEPDYAYYDNRFDIVDEIVSVEGGKNTTR